MKDQAKKAACSTLVLGCSATPVLQAAPPQFTPSCAGGPTSDVHHRSTEKMMMPSSQPDFSPSQFTPSQNAAADSTTPSKVLFLSSPGLNRWLILAAEYSRCPALTSVRWLGLQIRGASSTMPLTVKQIADAQQSGTPSVVDGVEISNVLD